MKKMGLKAGKDYIGVGVGAVILNEDGKIFLSQRGKKAKNEIGKWEFPGGSVEWGETLEQAINREIDEEYGFIIEVIELLAVSDHIILDEGQHWVSPSFICRIISGSPKIKESEKCSKIGWFTIDEIEKMELSIPTSHNLSEYKKKLNIYSAQK